MKKYNKYLLTAVLVIFVAVSLLPADDTSQKVNVPLTDPSKPGLLKVSINIGNLTVTGYSGKDVQVEAAVRTKKVSQKTSKGLKRIPNLASGLSVEEEDNTVEIGGRSSWQAIDITVKVPRKFSLELKVRNGGTITVTDVNGHIETKNYNGSFIKLKNVSGTIDTRCPNGRIYAEVSSFNSKNPHSFYAPNGTIDVTIPANTKANLKMRTINGNIYSDFEVTIRQQPPKIKKEDDGKRKKWVLFEKEMTGTINGGGQEIKLYSSNGNIYIRKK